ncbi:MAG: SDR family oxidoreductase [Ruminococcus flavefaciens]|nr:SDR family oxidoreductase [Ruminococcus flavefaciens]
MNKHRILLVTGASSEVGRKVIEQVADEYMWVLAHYNMSSSSIELLASKYKNIIPVQGNFYDIDSVLRMIDEIKAKKLYPDHILHLAAPKPENMQFRKTVWGDFSKFYEISYHAIVEILYNFLPIMQKKHYGKIVFMLSSYVLGKPPKYMAPYILSKYALLGLLNCLTEEYKDKGITFNGISPEMFDSQFLNEIPDLIKEKAAHESGIGRILRVDEIVPLIHFLLSDASDPITGQNMQIRGGIIND